MAFPRSRRLRGWAALAALLGLLTATLQIPAATALPAVSAVRHLPDVPAALSELTPADVKVVTDYDQVADWIFEAKIPNPVDPYKVKRTKVFELLPGIAVAPERFLWPDGEIQGSYLEPMTGMTPEQLVEAKKIRVKFLNIVGKILAQTLELPSGRLLLEKFGKMRPMPFPERDEVFLFEEEDGRFGEGDQAAHRVRTVIFGPTDDRAESMQMSADHIGGRHTYTEALGMESLVAFDPFYLIRHQTSPKVLTPRVILMHELTHAAHALTGVEVPDKVDMPLFPYEENRVHPVQKEEGYTTGGEFLVQNLENGRVPEYAQAELRWDAYAKAYQKMRDRGEMSEEVLSALKEQVAHRKTVLSETEKLTEFNYTREITASKGFGGNTSRGWYTNTTGSEVHFTEHPETVAELERPWEASNYEVARGVNLPDCAEFSATCALPVKDGHVDPPKKAERTAAVEEAEKWRTSVADKVKKLCSGRGTASCLETVDWNKLRTEVRTDAENLVAKKIEAVGTMHDIKLTPDMKESLEKPWSFYVPYEKTREKIATSKGELAWSRVTEAGGAALYLYGIYAAFSEDSTDLDKAAAISAIIPGVGDVLNLGVDIERKDWAGLGVDAAATAAGFLELAGVAEGIGGPAFALAMADHLILQWWYGELQHMKEVSTAVADRDKAWHKVQADYLQDPEKGWLAKDGGDQIVSMAIAFLQSVELQRASVKAVATAATKAHEGGAYLDPDKKDWSKTKDSEKADKSVDDLAATTPDIVRGAAAKALAKGMSEVWKEKQGKDFNQRWIDRLESFDVGTMCGPTPKFGTNTCRDDSRAFKDKVVRQLKDQTPAGITAKEVENILENFGLTDPGNLRINEPVRIFSDNDGARRYLHFNIETDQVDQRTDYSDPEHQDLRFRTTGRISDLEGILCMAAPSKQGDPVLIRPCTHGNSLEQRWEPQKDGRVKSVSTGLYLDAGDPKLPVTIWSKKDGSEARQVWHDEEPPRNGSKQISHPGLKKLITAPGSSGRLDGVIPYENNSNGFYLTSGSNIVGVEVLSGKDSGLNLDVGNITKTLDHWPGAVALTSESKDARITAGMRVPGHASEMYLFSGEKYIRSDARGNPVNSSRDIASNWPALKGLFAKSGVVRVDAIRSIPGVPDCAQFFSGAYSNQICINTDGKDRETRPVQPNSERWPEAVLNTGSSLITGFIPTRDVDMGAHVFAADQYTGTDRSTLPYKPVLDVGISVNWVYATLNWTNAGSLPAGTKAKVTRTGDDGTFSGTYDASPGRIGPDDANRRNILAIPRVHNPIGAGTNDATLSVQYIFEHPDGSVERSWTASKSFWCSGWKCDYY